MRKFFFCGAGTDSFRERGRIAVNDEGNLTIAIENKQEHKHHRYLRREFSYSDYEQHYTLPGVW